ncbi:hypothetical protein acdb102_31220 [Acidothermaceae bacterium B102]|nr:hypothetical protein acdb102_31220 [Acidothermaceae bacterium B102]
MTINDRAIRNQPATLTTMFYNDEAPVSADAAVTVTITKADGTTLASAAAATLGAVGVYTYALAPQALLNYLTVVWTGSFSGVTRSQTTFCEIRGGQLFSLAEARASDTALSDTTKYPTQLLKDCRGEIEDEFERITYQSFVPRFRRVTRDGTGTERMVMSERRIRTLLAGSLYGVALTTNDLAAVSPTIWGELVRTDGGFWTSGYRNVVVEFEYGWDGPPADVRKAALTRFRTRVVESRSGIPDRATSFAAPEGGTYAMATAGRNGWQTGIPDVDAVLQRYTDSIPGIA